MVRDIEWQKRKEGKWRRKSRKIDKDANKDKQDEGMPGKKQPEYYFLINLSIRIRKLNMALEMCFILSADIIGIGEVGSLYFSCANF